MIQGYYMYGIEFLRCNMYISTLEVIKCMDKYSILSHLYIYNQESILYSYCISIV